MAGFKSKKPKLGFNRPQATAGVVVDRIWRKVPMSEIEVGDIIAGMGLVSFALPTCDNKIYIEAGESTELELEADLKILAFVRKVD